MQVALDPQISDCKYKDWRQMAVTDLKDGIAGRMGSPCRIGGFFLQVFRRCQKRIFLSEKKMGFMECLDMPGEALCEL